MKRYRLTFIGLLLGIVIYLIGFIFDIDLFEYLIDKIHSFELIELDEVIISITIILALFVANILINNHKAKIESEKFKIYKAMLASLHHILNNFINQALIVKLEAENSKDFNNEILDIYDDIIEEATNLTKSLESVNSIDEDSITDSVKP